jgi:dihydroorotase
VPALAEIVALHTIFEMQRETGARVHLCRLSSAAGVELVRQAKHEGLPVTADVGIHHLHLTDVDIGYFDSNFRLDPPLRSQRDRDAIRAGVADGTIDAICSDHAPVGEDDKLRPFGEAAPGATALETLLPLVLKWSESSSVPLAAALAKVTSAPADILREPTGRLVPGAKADVVLVDARAHWTVTGAELVSRGGSTPFAGHELVGRAMLTLVGGEIRFDRRSGSDSNFR